jgi:hypothetical protein
MQEQQFFRNWISFQSHLERRHAHSSQPLAFPLASLRATAVAAQTRVLAQLRHRGAANQQHSEGQICGDGCTSSCYFRCSTAVQYNMYKQ